MKFKSTIILGIVLLIGIIGVYLIDYKASEEKKVEEELSKKLMPIESKNVIGIKLSTEFGVVSLARPEGGEYSIKSPVFAKGDKSAIGGMLSSVLKINKEREIASGENLNLAPYGLESPRVELEFILKDSSVSGFSLGGESPTGEYIFASVFENDKVFTLPKSLFAQTNKKLFELRNKKLLSFKSNEISKIAVKTTDYEYEINRLGGEYLMMKPASLNLEKNKVNSLLSRLSYEKAKKFIDFEQPMPDVTGLATAERTSIRLIADNPAREIELIVGNRVKEDGKSYRYAKDVSRSAIMLIDSGFAEFLEKDPFELIKKEVFSFEKNRVDALDIKHGDVVLNLTKNDSVWNVTQPDNFIANENKVNKLLDKFLSLKVSGVEEYNPKSFRNYVNKLPELTVTLYEDSVEANSFRVGRKIGNESFLKSGSSHPIYRVLNNSVEGLKVTSDYFKPEEK